MRHGVAGVKLNRSPAHRRALFRNLVTALLEREAIRTTDAKAKELRRWSDRMITLGKRGTLAARRRAARIITQPRVLKKLFDEIAPRFTDRQGGYTRVVKLGLRPGDAAAVSLVELVERAGARDEAETPKKRGAAPKAKKPAEKKKAATPKKPAPRRRAAG
jgi:large subunit ribosomal protein L17